MSDDGWTWELASKAQDDLDALASDEQERILDKLDEIVESPWREPPGYGEPLQNSPYKKVRVGEFRLSVTFRRENSGLSSPASNGATARTPPTMTDSDCCGYFRDQVTDIELSGRVTHTLRRRGGKDSQQSL